MKTLLIISYDRISDWINKGAFVSRYYNPGDLFDHVHLILLNDEDPDPVALQKMVGRARYTLHKFPTGIPFFFKTLGWQPLLLKFWARRFVRLAATIKPDLIRCHWGFLNGFIAREIKRSLGVPYTISLHINLDADVRPHMDWKRKIRDLAFKRFEGRVLRDADMVLPVYEPIVPYLKRHKVKRYQVAYNVINPEHIRRKTDYELHSPARIVCIGRQIALKNPTPLIEAVARLKDVHLTLIGNGELHASLQELVRRLGIEKRVEFLKDIPNDQVVQRLKDFDVYSAHSEHWELSKTLLEAFLTGLPVVINRRKGAPVPELSESICELVENSVEGYSQGLKHILENKKHRQRIAEEGFRIATQNWAPDISEQRYVSIYESILRGTTPMTIA